MAIMQQKTMKKKGNVPQLNRKRKSASVASTSSRRQKSHHLSPGMLSLVAVALIATSISSAFVISPPHTTTPIHHHKRNNKNNKINKKKNCDSTILSSSCSSSPTHIQASCNLLSKSSCSSSLPPSSSSSSSQSIPLKSFLPFENPSHQNSFTNGKIVTITSCQSRYGGRTNPIIVNPPSSGISGNGETGKSVLGFDLKMVSPSIEESQMENSPSSSSSSRSSRTDKSNSFHKMQQQESKKTTSSSSSSATPGKRNLSNKGQQQQQQQQHDYRGTIGIATLNQQNASPIKKQIVSNLLQSYNEFGQIRSGYSSRGGSGGTIQQQNRRKHNMNPFHFDRNDFTASSTTATTSPGNRRRVTFSNEDKVNPKTGNKSLSNGIGGSNVPMWFPYIPNRQQIDSLKLVELKDACYERGLTKSGNKQELQQRLFEWTLDQHKRRVLERNARRSTTSQPLHDAIDQAVHPNESFDSFLSSSFDSFSAAAASSSPSSSTTSSMSTKRDKQKHETKFPESKVDQEDIDNIEPLINRRKELLRSKQFSFSKKKKGVLGFEVDDRVNDELGDDNEDDDDDDEECFDDMDEFMSSPFPTADYLSGLTKTFHESKSVPHDFKDEMEIHALNNYQLKEIYLQAKYADQSGDYDAARDILQRLLQITPNDSRVIRRLARLHIQENNHHLGRQILQAGLHSAPTDVYLLQGLGQLERNCGNLMKARDYFKQAIQSSPDVPNPYHALGTLEHSQGNIRAATTVLRMGLKHCPSNHRLHHALGDLYREAKMLGMAEKAYLKGLKCLDIESDRTGRRMDWSRSFFYSAMSYLSYDLGDKGDCRTWLQKSFDMDKNKLHSQGWLGLAQLEESEGNFETARDIYYKALNVYEKYRGIRKLKTSSRSMLGSIRGNRSKPSKLGDRWLNVYESLARFEEEYGDYNSANNVYSRAATAFPQNWNILISWAKLQIKYKKYDRARTLLELACVRAGKSDFEPVRIFAEFEMSINNFIRARSILFIGAQSCSESSDGSLHNSNLSRLYHTWAICEWHLGNLDRVEVLFDHSLRVTDSGTEGSEMRALILLSIARFLFHAREEYSLAQHCISLSLAENTKSHFSWILWARIAEKMGNESLSKSCREEAAKIQGAANETFPSVKHGVINQMLRRAPWHHKIFNMKEHRSWYEQSNFPDNTDKKSHNEIISPLEPVQNNSRK